MTENFDIAGYWDNRYRRGRTSGSGSYGRLSQFKARFLNAFVQDYCIPDVIEFGCGDGNQLSLADYTSYIGVDISDVAIEMCAAKFSHDNSKRFIRAVEYAGETAQLSLSLDVLYHLVNDLDFDCYLKRVFDSADRFAIIYSSNDPELYDKNRHVRHRRFTDWTESRTDFALAEIVRNDFPLDLRKTEGLDASQYSPSDFYIYARR